MEFEVVRPVSTELEAFKESLEKSGDHVEQVKFPNGRGVSIVRHQHSYGGRSGLFELAVLDSTGEIDYSTPVTGDVLGYLTVDEVLQAMKQVFDLPPAKELES